MNAKYTLLTIATLALLSLSSCFKDNSTGADIAITELVPKGQLEELYLEDQGQTITIPCPLIEAKGESKPISYSWEVDGKEVSKEKDLVYECNKFGVFTIHLKVTNGESTTFFNSKLNVQYPYRKGIYFLWGNASDVRVGYIDPLQPKEKLHYNTLKLNNPGVTFTGEPHDIAFVTNERYGYKGFLMAVGLQLLTFAPDEMKFISPLKLSTDIMRVEGSSNSERATFFYNGRFGTFSVKDFTATNSDLRNKLLPYTTKQYGKEGLFAHSIVYWRRVAPDVYDNDGYMVYDNANEVILVNHSKIETWYPDETKGYELLEMLPLDYSRIILLYLKSKRDGSIKELKIKPGLHKASKKYNHPQELVYSGSVPSAFKLREGSILVASTSRKLVYYTSPEGQDIYAYSIVSEGNYTDTPVVDTPAGMRVVDMEVDRDNKYLYAALTDGSKSQIMRVDLETLKVDMEWSDLQANIIKIALREDNPVKK